MKQILDLIAKLYNKYRELFWYAVFGLATTAVNYGTYVLFTRVITLSYEAATVVGNVVSILFAYVTNRIFVFNSKTRGKALILEMLSFFAARAFSFFLDIAIVYVFATRLLYNDLIVKLVANVVIIILNYVLSKLIIFRKKKKAQVTTDASNDTADKAKACENKLEDLEDFNSENSDDAEDDAEDTKDTDK